MPITRPAVVAIVATYTLASAPSTAAAPSPSHKPCEMGIDERGAMMCELQGTETVLRCDLKEGKPQCNTVDGRAADCVNFVLVPGTAPTVYCMLPVADSEPPTKNRIVLTDADFGGPRQIVHRARAPQVDPGNAPQFLSPTTSGSTAYATDDVYRTLERSCEDAWRAVTVKATQEWNSRRSAVISMAQAMESACRIPTNIVLDDAQRRRYCDYVTNLVHNLSMQSPNDAASIRGAYQRVTYAACGR